MIEPEALVYDVSIHSFEHWGRWLQNARHDVVKRIVLLTNGNKQHTRMTILGARTNNERNVRAEHQRFDRSTITNATTHYYIAPVILFSRNVALRFVAFHYPMYFFRGPAFDSVLSTRHGWRVDNAVMSVSAAIPAGSESSSGLTQKIQCYCVL